MGDREYEFGQRTRRAAEPEPAVPTPGRRTLQGDTIAVGGGHQQGTRPDALLDPSAVPWGRELAAREAAKAAAADGARADQRAVARAIITGYAVAQHELESSGSPARTDAQLLHVLNMALEYIGGVEFEAVWAAADSFEQVVQARVRTSPGKYASLHQRNKEIRALIGLTGASKPRKELSADGGIHAKAAIGPALDVLGLLLRDSLRTLDEAPDDHGTRLRMVENAAGYIGATSEYVLGLLDQLSLSERRSIAPTAAAAALAAGKLLRWVRSRPAHARLEAVLMGTRRTGGILAFDAVLAAMGAPRIGERDEAPLSENQRHAAGREQNEFTEAFALAELAIRDSAVLERAGIAEFQDKSSLDDLPQPDFVKVLVDALVDETISAVIGTVAKLAAGEVRRVQQVPGAPSSGLGAPEAIESVIKVNATSVKKAMKATPEDGDTLKVDRRKLALIYFCGRLRTAATARSTLMMAKLLEARANGVITTADLRDLATRVEAHTKALREVQDVQLAKNWAQHLARSRIGVKGRAEDRVTDMGGYFGEKTTGGRVFGTSKAGTNGVLVVSVWIDGGVPRRDATKAEVRGLNSVLAADLYKDAENEVAKVELPKEIHVNAGFARARLALDERNRVRDVIDWEQVIRHVGGLDAHAFWRVWGPQLKLR